MQPLPDSPPLMTVGKKKERDVDYTNDDIMKVEVKAKKNQNTEEELEQVTSRSKPSAQKRGLMDE